MFLEDMTPEEIAALEAVGTLTTFKEGSLIMREGMSGSFFAVVISGEVEISKGLVDGTQQRLIKLGPSDVLGEIGFLGVNPRSANVQALTEAQLMIFERDDFKKLVFDRPEIGLKVYHGMAVELAQRLYSLDEDYASAINWAKNHRTDDSGPDGVGKMLFMVRNQAKE
jgi:CRP-like cAMP-binding protein